jgi:hypothetical protein
MPGPTDVLLLAKRLMADAEPYRVVTVLTAQQCADLRSNFVQPAGVCDRRPISDNVTKNILNVAPKCHRQGQINSDALAYLTNWCQGLTEDIPRPTQYRFLAHRGQPQGMPRGRAGAWVAPARSRVVDLKTDMRDADDTSDDDGLAPVDA